MKKMYVLLFFTFFKLHLLSSSFKTYSNYTFSDQQLTEIIVQLERASTKDDIETVKKIYQELEHDFFVSIVTSYYWYLGNTFLHCAAYESAIKIVTFLLSIQINPNILNIWDQTALMSSIHWGNRQIIRLLLQNNVDVNRQDFQGKTALHISIAHENLFTSWLLRNNGADLTIKDKFGYDAYDLIDRRGLIKK